ncbi:MAG: acyl-CoA thioesterase [Firmicutes bacterium]|nr:acyl-CoA thioesterase [Bacillota bacterium]
MKKASVDVTVAFRDLDGMRTAYHPVYIEWFDLARTKLLTECGIKFERWEKGGIVFPVVALHCEYKEGAAFGDKLRVTAMVREVRGKVLNVDYEIYSYVTEHIITTGYTTIVFCDENMKSFSLEEKYPELYANFIAE